MATDTGGQANAEVLPGLRDQQSQQYMCLYQIKTGGLRNQKLNWADLWILPTSPAFLVPCHGY